MTGAGKSAEKRSPEVGSCISDVRFEERQIGNSEEGIEKATGFAAGRPCVHQANSPCDGTGGNVRVYDGLGPGKTDPDKWEREGQFVCRHLVWVRAGCENASKRPVDDAGGVRKSAGNEDVRKQGGEYNE